MARSRRARTRKRSRKKRGGFNLAGLDSAKSVNAFRDGETYTGSKRAAAGFATTLLGGRKRRKTKRKKGGSSFTHQWQSVFSGTTPTEKWMKKHGKAIAPLALLG